MTARNSTGLGFTALLTLDEVRKVEQTYDQTHGVARRVAMTTLTKTSDELKQSLLEMAAFGEDAELVTQIIDEVSAHADHLVSELELTRTAHIRLLACLASFSQEVA